MNQLLRGIRWEENSDELSTDGGSQTELIGLRARTFPGLGTLSDSDLCRALNFFRTRNLIGFGTLGRWMNDPSGLGLPTRLNLQRARDVFRSSELYGILKCNFKELYPNFNLAAGLPDELSPDLRITR